MTSTITESLIEMHFHRALVDFFTRTYGVRFLKLIKPSSRGEKWIGFDQGWVHSEIEDDKLINEIKNAISHQQNKIKKFYLGYFLQFKRVHALFRKSKHKPDNYNLPYFRSELSLKADPYTGLSQHETLLLLSNVKNASVHYACAMLFDIDDIYDTVDLRKLRMVPLKSAPTGWSTNSRHFITFQLPDDQNPIWHSKPSPGKSYSFEDWASEKNENRPLLLDSKGVLILLEDIKRVMNQNIKKIDYSNKFLDFIKDMQVNEGHTIPNSFTLIEFESD